MLGQSFALSDIPKIAILSFLEILLSADNAIVLGLLVSKLADEARKKALYIGVVSAIFLRAICLLAISVLIQYHWVQILGAVYLIYLSLRYFKAKKHKDASLPQATPNFWKTVLLIELFDLAFAMDSMIAGVAFINGSSAVVSVHPKLWIVYLGGLIGLLSIRYAAKLFAAWLHRFKRLEMSAHIMIGWIGLKLGYSAIPQAPNLNLIFWAGLLLFFALGFMRKR